MRLQMTVTKIRKRDGRLADFNEGKIAQAITKAFNATYKPGQEETAQRLAEEVLSILEFWADKGVDGYRLDAINYLYKEPGYPDVEPMPGSPYGFATAHYANKPRVHEHFRTLRSRVMGPRGLSTVVLTSCPSLLAALCRSLHWYYIKSQRIPLNTLSRHLCLSASTLCLPLRRPH